VFNPPQAFKQVLPADKLMLQ